MIHTDAISHFDKDYQELARQLGDLKYDTLASFLKLLADKIYEDGKKDNSRGRQKLSRELFEAATSLKEASHSINNAWSICKPYMNPT